MVRRNGNPQSKFIMMTQLNVTTGLMKFIKPSPFESSDYQR